MNEMCSRPARIRTSMKAMGICEELQRYLSRTENETAIVEVQKSTVNRSRVGSIITESTDVVLQVM